MPGRHVQHSVDDDERQALQAEGLDPDDRAATSRPGWSRAEREQKETRWHAGGLGDGQVADRGRAGRHHPVPFEHLTPVVEISTGVLAATGNPVEAVTPEGSTKAAALELISTLSLSGIVCVNIAVAVVPTET